MKIDRIKIGFCSETCKSIYRERVKEFKSRNRKKSFKFFLFGMVSILAGAIIFKSFISINPENLEQAYHKSIVTIVFQVLIFSGITQIAYGFWALFKGYDPDIYT
jgi:uncharacterized membrane protein HdeD (DUF308 family)